MSSKSGMEQVLVENEVQQVKLLDSVYDRYGGVVVELSEAMNSKVFASMLEASLALWRSQGIRAVWIKVPIGLGYLLEAAVKEGFRYHHAESEYLMLVIWIPDDAHTLPANASHRVVIGAFVMNKKREVLVVLEKRGIFRGSGVWKFPTGVVDEGEDICAAAMREVKEETAIDTEFVEVLAFRQSQKSLFEKSDLFFVCLLRPLSFDIKKQESEIEDAQWMPWDEYVAQPFIQKHELMKHVVDICKAKDGTYFRFSPAPVTSKFSDQKSFLYMNDRDLKGSKIHCRTACQELKMSVKELASQAASLANAEAEEIITPPGDEIVTPPKSGYQFVVSWQGCSGDCVLQSRIEKVSSPSALPQIFKNALSTILIDMIKWVATFFLDDMDLAVKYLENLAKVPTFDMLIKSLSSTEMSDLVKLWDGVICGEAVPIEHAEILDNLRSKYCPKC